MKLTIIAALAASQLVKLLQWPLQGTNTVIFIPLQLAAHPGENRRTSKSSTCDNAHSQTVLRVLIAANDKEEDQWKPIFIGSSARKSYQLFSNYLPSRKISEGGGVDWFERPSVVYDSR